MVDDLAQRQQLVDELPPAARALLAASWGEAARVFSPHGCDRYMEGAAALQRLGRGEELVLNWLEAAPQVARELGEDMLDALLPAALALASRTSGAVIARVLATAPTAASRLGDPALFAHYLQFLDQLVALAPRGLRPMLDKLEPLLAQLTLGGLRRWAMWGARAHRIHFDEQARYFALDTRESLAVLQQERKGTLFVDVQRRLNMYLRALWGRDFFLRPTAGDFETREGLQPYVEDQLIHLPDAFDDVAPASAAGAPLSGLALYRAAAAHCAAHLAYTRAPLSSAGLDAWQRALVGAVEDARIEALAIRAFPGLQALWAPFHAVAADEAVDADDPDDALRRLARALLDPAWADPDPWIGLARELFAAAAARLETNEVAGEIGLALARARPAPGWRPRRGAVRVAYRDDNRYTWAFSATDAIRLGAAAGTAPRQVRRRVGLMEFANEVEVETAGEDAQEVWVLGSELFPYEDRGVSFNESEGRAPVPDPCHYPEWDYQLQLARPSWVTVFEERPPAGDARAIDDIVTRHKPLVARMKYLFEALQPQGVQRLRKLEDGDDIDIEAAVRARVDLRMGLAPDPRIMMRSVRKVRDLAVLVLLDLSESTNDPLPGQPHTILELTREACALLGDAIAQVGDPFAIHGFSSDGRHAVAYSRFKDFGEPYGAPAKARLAGMSARHSTRMGAAVRHATRCLAQQGAARKLLLVLTDGEPADVDVRDPQYLRHDARKAVEEAARAGVRTYCLSLDPRADRYVSHIFGATRFRVLDHVARLPAELPLLYAGLTR